MGRAPQASSSRLYRAFAKGQVLLHLGVGQYDFSTVDEIEEALKAHKAYPEIAHIVTITPELHRQLEEDKATSSNYWDWFTRLLHPDPEERDKDGGAAD